MAQLEKLKAAFRACDGPFKFREFARLLSGLGYVAVGKPKGSRRRYFSARVNHLITLHEPHDGEMGPGMVRRLQEELQSKGLLR